MFGMDAIGYVTHFSAGATFMVILSAGNMGFSYGDFRRCQKLALACEKTQYHMSVEVLRYFRLPVWIRQLLLVLAVFAFILSVVEIISDGWNAVPRITRNILWLCWASGFYFPLLILPPRNRREIKLPSFSFQTMKPMRI